jgi:hypothetical protein
VADNRITIILPCAGEGSRLALQTPKELFEIEPGVRLVDYSLRHILAAARQDKFQITAAVVIRPGKFDVVDYVSQRLAGITVETVMFDSNYREWPGSVYSAKGVFSENNLVLLPDSYLSLTAPGRDNHPDTTDSRGKTLVETVLAALSRYKVVFGCIPCKDPQRLKNLGAVRIEKNVITAFRDKPPPGEQSEILNGFWGCYAFKKSEGKALYDFLIRAVRQEPLPLTGQPFNLPGVIPVAEYYDLGTWEIIETFRKEMRHRDSGPMPHSTSSPSSHPLTYAT